MAISIFVLVTCAVGPSTPGASDLLLSLPVGQKGGFAVLGELTQAVSLFATFDNER